jgi:hypothetical protein
MPMFFLSSALCLLLFFIFVFEGGKKKSLLTLQSLQFHSNYMTSSNKASLKDRRYLTNLCAVLELSMFVGLYGFVLTNVLQSRHWLV